MALLAGRSASSPGTNVSSARAEKNVSPACAAASAFAESQTNFQHTLKAGTTVEQVIPARDQVAKTYDDLVKTRQDVAPDELKAVKKAEKKFDVAVRVVPNDGTLAQTAAYLRDDAANAHSAVTVLQTATKC